MPQQTLPRPSRISVPAVEPALAGLPAAFWEGERPAPIGVSHTHSVAVTFGVMLALSALRLLAYWAIARGSAGRRMGSAIMTVPGTSIRRARVMISVPRRYLRQHRELGVLPALSAAAGRRGRDRAVRRRHDLGRYPAVDRLLRRLRNARRPLPASRAKTRPQRPVCPCRWPGSAWSASGQAISISPSPIPRRSTPC